VWQKAMSKNILNLLLMIIVDLNLAACGSMPPSAVTATLQSDAVTVSDAKGFTLSSPAVTEGGALPAEYTCDGASATLPLTWSGAPAGTRSYAVIMHHVAGPGDTHWYWVLYDIPAV
jgi:phosphatidylethanolamine-binding protein (PEBP) family uncharacterized protein